MSTLFFRDDTTSVYRNMRGPNLPQTTTQTFTANTYAAVTVPTGCVGFIMDVPASYTGTIIQKGVTGDTGIYLTPTNKSPHGMDSANLGFGLLCSVNVIITFYWI